MVPDGVSIDGPVLEFDEEGGLWLGRLAGGAEEGVPVMDEVARGDEGSGDGDGADELGAEDIVVLDMENDGGGLMGKWDLEVLFPLGALGIRDDAGAGNGCAGDGDGDVGVTGDDLGVGVAVVGWAAGAGAGGRGRGGGGNVTSYKFDYRLNSN